jgi:hypothetical protein
MMVGLGYLLGGGFELRGGCQQYKGVLEGLNGPSVCSVQRLGTVRYSPRGSSVHQEMALRVTSL